MNNLSDEKRYHLKIAVILIAIIFLTVYGTLMFLKYSKGTSEKKNNTKNGQVVFKQPELKFFNYSTQLNTYPDRIEIHYPYLMVIRPDRFRSEIYNMDTKIKEKEIHEVVLDYFKGNIVYNKQGYQTYFNNKDLGLLCDQAFIKSKTEILCITRPDQNKQANKLIEINPQTLKQKAVYEPQNVLTAVAYYKNTLYTGEYDFAKNKAYITVNGNISTIADLVNVIYPIREYMYAASFKTIRNKQTESNFKIIISSNHEVIKIKRLEQKEIIFN
jgi:hypothetical protein